VEVDGQLVDVRLEGERVHEVGRLLRHGDERVVEGHGCALLPGLHDHHLHLLALAAVQSSIDVADGLQALRDLPGTGWVRAVGWAGGGEQRDLDALVGPRPVRVQHRSGALWLLSTSAVQELDLTAADHPGIERDERGDPTGRLWRADDLLADRLGREVPDLQTLGKRLNALGITGVTDATPELDPATCALLAAAVPQRLQLLGEQAGTGPWKIVLPDHDLPTLDALVEALRQARPRPVAVHCVTRQALVLLLTALDVVGRLPHDRVEHAAVVPLELAERLPTVVTQPGFLTARGDDYLSEVEAENLPDLYRYRSLLDAGCRVVPSSDAPYGPLDPWAVLRAARDRRSASGVRVGPTEAIEVRTALEGMLLPLDDLSAPPRRVVPGAAADLVLLGAPLRDVLEEPDADAVRATWIRGVRVY
jgi:predicted amidohydrolase YtcJ